MGSKSVEKLRHSCEAGEERSRKPPPYSLLWVKSSHRQVFAPRPISALADICDRATRGEEGPYRPFYPRINQTTLGRPRRR